MCIVYGIPIERRTDLFHPMAYECGDLLIRSQVRQPYRTQQYVVASICIGRHRRQSAVQYIPIGRKNNTRICISRVRHDR